MAVYTTVDADALDAWIAGHDVGTVVACEGIAAGIENSNFFVTTADDEQRHVFVLTLFERLSLDELPYYLALMQHLAASGIPCPAPVADHRGALCSMLAAKPAALVTRVSGRSVLRPTPAHCAAIAQQLARMHLAAESFDGAQPNPRGHDWWFSTATRVRPVLDIDQRELLDAEIDAVRGGWIALVAHLPQGAIHADVFRDNVLFEDDAVDAPVVGGIIDFYFAGTDCFVFDLAVSLNDWCVVTGDGAFDGAALQAFIDAYRATRPLSTAEQAALPTMLRAAALRFWLSRVDDLHRPRPAQLLTPHDPAQFERILRLRSREAVSGASPLDRAW